MLIRVVLALLIAGSPQDRLDEILQKAGERVQAYAEDMQRIVCTEINRQQELESDLKTAKKKPAELVYDFIIVPIPGVESGIREMRQLKSIDGKPAATNARPPSPDPTAFTTSPLMLIPRAQVNNKFSFAGTGDLDGRPALMIDFSPAQRQPSRAAWDGEFFRLFFQTKGRIWIDPITYDVLRIDTHLIEPFEFKGPRARKGPFVSFAPGRKFKAESWDVSIRFRAATFDGAEGVARSLMLPASAESVRVVQGLRIPRLRATHTFTAYRRFTADIKIQ